MTRRRHRPLRTCLGCRETKPKDTLIRLVRDASGAVRVDPRRTAAGRGAYICSNAACADRAARGRRLAHAFGKPSHAGTDLVMAVLRAAAARGD